MAVGGRAVRLRGADVPGGRGAVVAVVRRRGGSCVLPACGRDGGGDAADAAIAVGSHRHCDSRRGVGSRSLLRRRSTRASGFALANSVEPVVGASLVLAWCNGPPDLRVRADLAKFVAAACAGGAAGRRVDRRWRQCRVERHLMAYRRRALVGGRRDRRSGSWSANSLVAHTISHPAGSDSQRLRWWSPLTAVLSLTAFWWQAPPTFLLLPVMAWAAFRLDVIGAAVAGAVLAFTVNYMAGSGRGFFAGMNLAAPARLAVNQVFIAVIVLVAMLIAQEAAGRIAAVRQGEAERRERGPTANPCATGAAVVGCADAEPHRRRGRQPAVQRRWGTSSGTWPGDLRRISGWSG